MATDVKVPALGESITEATLGAVAEEAGRCGRRRRADRQPGDRQGRRSRCHRRSPARWASNCSRKATRSRSARSSRGSAKARAAAAAAPRGRSSSRAGEGQNRQSPGPGQSGRRRRESGAARGPCRAADHADLTLSPAVRRAVLEHHVDPSKIHGTGKDGRLTKDDVLAAAKAKDGGPGRTSRRRRRRQRPLLRAPQRRACLAAGALPGERKRRAGQDDPASPDHRDAPQGSAEHRRAAHHLQRRRHVGGDRRARPLQGSVREEARHPPRLHGLLREGGGARRARRAVGQRPHRGRRDRLSRLSRRLGRGVGAQGPGRAGHPQRRRDELRRDREDHRRLRQEGQGRHADRSTT